MLLEILRQHVQILVRIQLLCKKEKITVIAGTSLLSASGDSVVQKIRHRGCLSVKVNSHATAVLFLKCKR